MIDNLLSSIRQTALTTKIPCANWYKNNEIEFGLNDEISVLPMTHRDEILIHNPDALFSNNAVAEILKSCIPNINNVSEILMPDVELLLLAIKVASVGQDIEVQTVCPHCLETYNNAADEEKKKLVDENKISIKPQTFLFDARHCLESFTPKLDNYTVNLCDSMSLELKPIALKDNSKLEILKFETQNAIKQFLTNPNVSITDGAEMIADVDKWNQNKEKNELFNELLLKLDDIAIESLICSVKSITVKDQSSSDYEAIKLFLNNIPAEMFNIIRDEIQKVNESTLDKTYYCKCKYCQHEWEKKDLEFNFSNFFAIGS